MSKDTVFLAVTPSLRTRLATTIENLIALLDEIDGDENLEEAGDLEPSLGWPNWYGPAQLDPNVPQDLDLESDLGIGVTYTDAGPQYDLEMDTCDDEENGDKEPNLGWGNPSGQGPRIGMEISPGDVTYDPNDTDMIGVAGRYECLSFNGKGYREGKEMLQELRQKRPDVKQEVVTVIAGGYGW